MSIDEENIRLREQLAERDQEIERLLKELTTEKRKNSMRAVATSFAFSPGRAPRAYPLPVVAKSGTRLKQTRERLGLSQRQLGERLGLARTSIANYENGLAPLSAKIKKWIASQKP